MRDKGRQKRTVMTTNGRIRVWRKRWQPVIGGSVTPIDKWLDRPREAFTRGVVELACRLNRHVSSFKELAAILWRAAGLKIGKEKLRELVEAEGRLLLEKARQGELRPQWQASDCLTEERETRVYFGCDGVKVPVITDTEKKARRAKTLDKRKRLRRLGRHLQPLSPMKAGADGSYKEFRVVQYYS